MIVGIEIFTDESIITSCLINMYSNKIFLKGKYEIFHFMFTDTFIGFTTLVSYIEIGI